MEVLRRMLASGRQCGLWGLAAGSRRLLGCGPGLAVTVMGMHRGETAMLSDQEDV